MSSLLFQFLASFCFSWYSSSSSSVNKEKRGLWKRPIERWTQCTATTMSTPTQLWRWSTPIPTTPPSMKHEQAGWQTIIPITKYDNSFLRLWFFLLLTHHKIISSAIPATSQQIVWYECIDPCLSACIHFSTLNYIPTLPQKSLIQKQLLNAMIGKSLDFSQPRGGGGYHDQDQHHFKLPISYMSSLFITVTWYRLQPVENQANH